MNKIERTLVTILAIVVGFYIAYYAVKGIIGSQEVKSPEVQTVFRDNFMSGCTQTGESTVEQCSCAYSKLENKYGLSAFIKTSMEFDRTGVLPDDYITTVVSCI
jgi:hypothetical protein